MEVAYWWNWIGYGCTGVILVLQWMSVIAMYKGGRDQVWWLLTVGVSFATLGLLILMGSFVFLQFAFGYNSEFYMTFSYLSWGLSLCGNLVFAIGILQLALRYGGLREKNAQLEQVLASLQQRDSS